MSEVSAYAKTKPEWGFRVEMWMMHELGLRGIERDVYAVVYAFTFEGGWKQIEMGFLAEFVGATDRRVQQVIRDLVSKGLLEYATVATRRGERVQLRAVVPDGIGEKESRPRSDRGEKISGGGVKKFQGRGEKISPPYKQDINKIKKHTQKGAAPQQSEAVYTATATEGNVAPHGARACDSSNLGKGFETFAVRYPKPPKPAVRRRARLEWARLVAEGWTPEQIAERLDAYVARKRAEGVEVRYWRNLADFLAAEVEASEGVYAPSAKQHAKPASELPEEAECPRCGCSAEREGGTRLYYCRECDASFSAPSDAREAAC